MADFIDQAGEVVTLAHTLAPGSAGGPDVHVNLEGQLMSVAGRLRGHAGGALSGPFETESIRSAIAAARAALELETAARCVADSAKQTDRAKSLLNHMAYAQCLAALGPLGREMAPVGDFAAHPFIGSQGSAQVRGAVPGAAPGAAADIRVLKDISFVHRQHARYHSLRKYDQAREIAHESHKVKTLADLWLRGGGPKPLADVDFSDPRYRAAPCSDLNAPDAIPNIGFLFLEGQGKPPELTILEERLGALAADIEPFGTHLIRAMDAAWVRESALFAPDRIDIAWTRLLVVLCNWRSGHDAEVAGRLIARCKTELARLDLTPTGVRANMKVTGAKLADIGWVLDMAAQLCANAGMTLADNNWRYTQYSAFMENL
jgi:hypothetical protein